MTLVALDEAVTGSALRATRFFNGRLLTGEDLDREQRVQAARLARLGTAIGDGVVQGLAVDAARGSTAARPSVTVTPGLAISRSGRALQLFEDTEVALARTGPRPGSEPGGLFADCQPYTASEYSTGAGVYLLSLRPASVEEGLAPVSGLHNAVAPCNTAFAVEAVSFRLVRLALPVAELDEADKLRNRVAYRMFAPYEVAELERDPFGATLGDYGLLDRLRRTALTDDEVPLALIGWDARAGVRWVDRWAVRRRPARPGPPGKLGPHAADRLLAEGEARFLQFQEQAADRIRAGGAHSVSARSELERLPAAGLLRIRSATAGFDAPTFFAGLTTRGPAFVERERVQPLLRASFAFPPIDLAAGELIWLYQVRENRDPNVAGDGTGRPYVLFASGYVPYAANAQYDLSYWDFASYALPAC